MKTTSQMNEWDYVLVKHLDSQGNQELRYKQLAVTMPDLSGLGDGLSALSTVVYEHSVEITSLSTEVVELSGKLSADYWEQGGYHNTCYGSSIGDSGKALVIDLDHTTLAGSWYVGGSLEAVRRVTAGQSVTIGNTTINEAQLSALLQLVNAPQQLHNL